MTKLAIGLMICVSLSVSAFGNTIIYASRDTGVTLGADSVSLMIGGDSADRLFDSLAVKATGGHANDSQARKAVAGISCFSEGNAVRQSRCQISVDRLRGVLDATLANSKGEKIVLFFRGTPAEKAYKAL